MIDLKWADKRNVGPSTYSSDSPGPGPPATPTVLKRRAPNDENQPPLEIPRNKRQKKNKATGTPFTPLAPQQPTQHRFEDHEKFDRVCDALGEVNWTFAEMLGYAFLHPGTIHRGHRHCGIISRFLRGESKVTPGEILQLWDNHPDGREERDSVLLYSTDIHFSQIKPIRPALTSYAAQKCLGQVHREGAAAVKPSAGLHASARKNTNKGEQVGDQAKKCTEGAQVKAGDASVVAVVKGGSAVMTTAQFSTRHPMHVVRQ